MRTYNVNPPKQPCVLNQSELILFWLRFENYNFHTPRLVPRVPSFVWDTAETSYFHRAVYRLSGAKKGSPAWGWWQWVPWQQIEQPNKWVW